MRALVLLFCLVFSGSASSQDTIYARKVIGYLTSKKCYGRGYLNNGLKNAGEYLVSELKKLGAKPLLPDGFYQSFYFDVNTFPSDVVLEIDGKKMEPGVDFIPDPESRGVKGLVKMVRKDSLNFISNDPKIPLILSLKKKLTFSVGTSVADHCTIELLKKNAGKDTLNVKVNIGNKFIKNFRNNNICAFIEGKNKDSIIVFSAHYDHLGGIGKKVYFPGANDNASGVSLLLNLVKFYKENPPGYNIAFIFFAGEEAGLIGSKYFVANRSTDLTKIKFLINLDLLGTGDDGMMVVNGAVYPKQFEQLLKINGDKHLVKEIKKRGKAANSDHYWFTEAGVPAFFIYTLGGTSAYHDVYDRAEQLPLTDYVDVMQLLTFFVNEL